MVAKCRVHTHTTAEFKTYRLSCSAAFKGSHFHVVVVIVVVAVAGIVVNWYHMFQDMTISDIRHSNVLEFTLEIPTIIFFKFQNIPTSEYVLKILMYCNFWQKLHCITNFDRSEFSNKNSDVLEFSTEILTSEFTNEIVMYWNFWNSNVLENSNVLGQICWNLWWKFRCNRICEILTF